MQDMILVKMLCDKHGNEEVVLYEHGKFCKPLIIITKYEAQDLLKKLQEALKPVEA